MKWRGEQAILMVCWCICAGRKGRLPEKVTQSHPHPAAKETGVQRGRDLQQSQGHTAESGLDGTVQTPSLGAPCHT